MKIFIVILFTGYFAVAHAGNPYRDYLLMKTLHYQPRTAIIQTTLKPAYIIPHYQIPKASVFCVMEDKLNKAAKIWIKIGVK